MREVVWAIFVHALSRLAARYIFACRSRIDTQRRQCLRRVCALFRHLHEWHAHGTKIDARRIFENLKILSTTWHTARNPSHTPHACSRRLLSLARWIAWHCMDKICSSVKVALERQS